MKAVKYLVAVAINLFTVLKKLKECVGFFFFNNLIATNECTHENIQIKSSGIWKCKCGYTHY